MTSPNAPWKISNRGAVGLFVSGCVVGWTGAKVALAFLWAKRRAVCLRWLNKNSTAFGIRLEVAVETNRRDAEPPLAEAFVAESLLLEGMPEATFQACCALWAHVFAKDGRTAATVAAERRPSTETAEMWHLVWTDQGPRKLVAAARTFQREVSLGDGSRRAVLALAHVASDPACRGLGLGAKVVRQSFAQGCQTGLRSAAAAPPVGSAASPRCFLFQTGVEGFYRKLGARTLDATLYPVGNSTGHGSDAKRRAGFWDPTVMVYPGDAAVPLGPIDLLGPGY